MQAFRTVKRLVQDIGAAYARTYKLANWRIEGFCQLWDLIIREAQRQPSGVSGRDRV